MPDATISTRQLMRIIIMLIAVWSITAGAVLLAFPSAGSGALGSGIADRAGQRLVGVHLLLLAPVYLLIAARLERYAGFIWLPIAGQTAMALTVAYNIISGDTSFSDGALSVVICLILAGLLSFIWITEQRTIARNKMLADTDVESLSSRPQLPAPADDDDDRTGLASDFR
jgi:hypothetical protein